MTILSARAVADMLGMTRHHLNRMAAAGEIPAAKVCGRKDEAFLHGFFIRRPAGGNLHPVHKGHGKGFPHIFRLPVGKESGQILGQGIGQDIHIHGVYSQKGVPDRPAGQKGFKSGRP